MKTASNSRVVRTIPLLIAFCFVSVPAQAQYSGGSGTADDPYQIATAEDLILLGETPDDYDKHFMLMAHIDLSGYVYDRAVIAPDLNDANGDFDGTPFTGVFEGNNHIISRLTIVGESYLGLFGRLESGATVSHLGLEAVDVSGTGDHIGGLAGLNHEDGSITNSYSTGTVTGREYVGGLVGSSIRGGSITASYSTGAVTGDRHVGGLVGCNDRLSDFPLKTPETPPSRVADCFSNSTVTGGQYVGGLVGANYGQGSITASYSTGAVTGDRIVGGLVGRHGSFGICGMPTEALPSRVADCFSNSTVTGGENVGGLVGGRDDSTSSITNSYSTGVVSGDDELGGLVGGGGIPGCLVITSSFWDIHTSGLTDSVGGTGLTTAEMQTAATFLEAGWDFVDETENGTDDIWWIEEGQDYPRLGSEVWASSPNPQDGATGVVPTVTLRWRGTPWAVEHDVYFGEKEPAVANATTDSESIYVGRYAAGTITYDPGVLELNRTYYWRIDEVTEGERDNPWKGCVWSFTTVDHLVVTVLDDFEGYHDGLEGEPEVSMMWIDGSANGTMGLVSLEPENGVVHDGCQAMLFTYWNFVEPWYGQTERLWQTPQNWTLNDADTLTLYIRGALENDPEPLYVAIEDGSGRIGVVIHPDAEAVLATEWQKWHVALADLQGQGVDVAAVKRMIIGVGDENDRQHKRIGTVYIDDISLTSRTLIP